MLRMVWLISLCVWMVCNLSHKFVCVCVRFFECGCTVFRINRIIATDKLDVGIRIGRKTGNWRCRQKIRSLSLSLSILLRMCLFIINIGRYWTLVISPDDSMCDLRNRENTEEFRVDCVIDNRTVRKRYGDSFFLNDNGNFFEDIYDDNKLPENRITQWING